MYRTRFTAAVVFTFFALCASAHEPSAARRVEERLDLHAIFALAPGVISEDENGITVSGFAVDVVVAHIDEDGRLVKACVGNEEAAHRFFEKPSSKKEAQEK